MRLSGHIATGVAGALTLCLALGASTSEAGAKLCAVRTTDFSVGLISDWHGGGPQGIARNIPAWLAAQDPAPSVVLHAGDVYLGTAGNWLEMQAAFAAYGMRVYTCLGNHDFDTNVTDDGPVVLYPEGESPLDNVVGPHIREMRTVPFYAKDFGPVRVLFLDNCYDTTVVMPVSLRYYQVYAECNPPGRGYAYWAEHGFAEGKPNGVNPEFAGWVTSDSSSGQLAWIKQATAGFGGTFLLAVAHRSPYAPYQISVSRPPDLGGRYTGWALLSRVGVDLALTGDEHTCGLTKRMYKGAQSAAGTHFFEARCAFRRVAAFGTGEGTCKLVEGDTYWPKEADLTDANESPSTVFGYAVFHGDRATVKVIQGHSDGSFDQRAVVYIDRRAR